MRITGAFWPQHRKVGAAKIQRKFNCDPIVGAIFPTHLVTMKELDGPVYIHVATREQWEELAKKWEADIAMEYRRLERWDH